jgi:hypothetical protein
MAKFTHELFLTNDIDDVFSFISNPVNNPVWDSYAFKTEFPNGSEIEAGTTGKGMSTFLGETYETDFIFNEYKPPKSVAHRTKARAVDVEMSSDLEELKNGIKVTLDIDVKFNGGKKLLAPLLKKKIKKRINENLEVLKLNLRLMSLKRV